MTIRYFAPAPSLRRFISSYYWFDADAPFADLIRAELPQLRFRLRGTCTFRFGKGAVQECPPVMLSGPTASPVLFATGGPLTAFGAGLLPAGWAALIGADADKHADALLDFTQIDPATSLTCLDRLINAGSDSARVAAADQFFLMLAAAAHDVPYFFTRVADDWLTATPSPEVDTLVARSGLSARQVERLSRRIYGGAPKLMSRKYRALQAAVRLGNGEARSWSDAAGDAFYDQSHFIREFKTFVGMTPSRFARDAAPISRLTIARRAQLPDMPRLALLS